jgi:hypothetical protein
MNKNTAPSCGQFPPAYDLPSPERHHSPLAGFIVCALAGAIFGFATGMLTAFIIWHR